jgi:hypothetical protein
MNLTAASNQGMTVDLERVRVSASKIQVVVENLEVS